MDTRNYNAKFHILEKSNFKLLNSLYILFGLYTL
jgi:hypothetical protein